MKISAIVPTFNRGPALAETVGRLARSVLDASDELEVIVVDDGSRVPAQQSVGPLAMGDGPSWPVRWLRQDNAGPAAARNAGFRASAGALVLFVDDDILVPPDLVRAHIAAHERRPGCAVFGLCPFAPANEEDPFRRYLAAVLAGPARDEEFVAVPIVASGQLSVEKSQFSDAGGVYATEMRTPAAEEYELSFRLRQRGIAILAAPRIVAVHDQPVDLVTYCRQQYKHGVGSGEAARKRPDLLALPELAQVVAAAEGRKASPIHAARVFVTAPPLRAGLLAVTQILERLPAPHRLRTAAYHATVSAHFVAGVRDGLARFAGKSR